MLACARIGAVHSVVFGGFSAEALRDRINDAQASVLVTADGGYRRGHDRAAQADGRRGARATRRRSSTSSSSQRRQRRAVRRPHAGGPRPLVPRADAGRVAPTARPSRWTPRTCSTSSTRPAPPESRRASSTRPAGIWSARTRRRSGSSICGTTTSTGARPIIGWVTGHSYVVYGPLANGATVLMYEGAPDWPQKDRFWQLDRAVRRHDLLHRADRDSRVHEVGHRVAREARPQSACACSDRSASRSIPKRGCGTTSTSAAGRCPIVDTWWQTETGHILITPLPGITHAQARVGDQGRFPASRAEIRTAAGEPRRRRAAGCSRSRSRGPACCAASTAIPSASCSSTGASGHDGVYFTGDGARVDRGRRLLAARPRRRRAERRRPSHRHDGSRERARRSSDGGRGRGRRQDARDQGPGGRGVRDAEGRRRRRRPR